MAGSYAWDDCGNNQLVSGNVVRDGASRSGLYSITTPIPTSLNLRCLTKADLATYTNIPTGNSPLNSLTSNQCPTKDEILGVF